MQLELNGAAQARPAPIARARPATTQSSTTVVTRMVFAAPPKQVWNGLLFYEQIQERPPLHLRLLLPVPVRTEGPKSQVGDDVKCVYECGDLIKRITRIDAPRHYEFEVIEQNLKFGGGLALIGGGYALRLLEGGGTEVGITTRYVSAMRPAWLWRPVEATACHMFHRHLLSAMRRAICAQNVDNP
ncbi:MAG TPA: hypothetical protein VMM27_05280 [Casimicrobiaceae bacterium]|nr:hypothetical protein [Casimicrobiaceae bacterium]